MSGEAGRTWPENAWPTAEQYLDWLLTLDREQQLEQIGSRLLDAEHAQRCVMRNHDGMQAEIEWLREQAAQGVMLRNRLRGALGAAKGTELEPLLLALTDPRAEKDAKALATPIRPYREGTPLVAVSESAWEEAQEAEAQVIELQDALANANAYIELLPDRVADFLLSYSAGGNPTDPWQVGHNYAMREAARMVREKWYELGLGQGHTAPADASSITEGDPDV